jgi:hypothetical protein
MGFLRRLFGGSDITRGDSSTQQLQLEATWFTRLRDDAALEVVGEFYRQEGVLSARPPGPTDLPPGVPPPPAGLFKAMLIRQPTNQYDPNAIAVLLWSGGTWTHAGYLSRNAAVEYGSLFRHLEAAKPGSTPAIACDANRVRERDAFGVVLHLGTPGECVARACDRWPQPDPGASLGGKVTGVHWAVSDHDPWRSDRSTRSTDACALGGLRRTPEAHQEDRRADRRGPAGAHRQPPAGKGIRGSDRTGTGVLGKDWHPERSHWTSYG